MSGPPLAVVAERPRAESAAPTAPADVPARTRIGYVLSRFPQISESFILREMQGLESRGHDVVVIAPVLDRAPVRQPGTEPFVDSMIRPRSAVGLAAAQVHWLRRDPSRYLRLWRDALWGNRRSPKFVVRAAAMVPFAALAAKQLGAEPVDRLHAHYTTHSLLCAWAIWRLTGTPYSVTCHAHDLYVDRTMLREKLEGATAIVAISEFNRRLLAQTCGPAIARRTTVIHCGVDTDEFAPPAGERDGPFRFVVVGSMQPYKGHRYALEAFAQLGPDRDTELVLIGDGELRPALEALAAELAITDRVRFLGAQPGPNVLAELRRADCVLQPSVVTASGKMEGIPVALMEALACARPVIASELSGVPELVRDGDTGVLVPPGDAAALAAAMRQAVAEPLVHRRMAERGRALVAAEFDLRSQIDQLNSVLVGPLTGTRTP